MPEELRPMTLQRLREIRKLRKEIEDLERLRETFYFPVRSPASGSESHGTTPGDPTARALHDLERIDCRIANKIGQLREEVELVMDYLDTVEDSDVRRCIICHYMHGMTWEQTTRHVLGYYGSDTAKKRVYRHFGLID